MPLSEWNHLIAPHHQRVHTPDWKPLSYFNAYRLLLATLFTILFLAGPTPSLLGSHHPELFLLSAVFYLIFSIFSVFTIHRQHLRYNWQTKLQILVDILVLTLLMHSSGGLTTGMGILLVIAIAGNSIIMAGRMAILFAAIATLTILIEQVYAHINQCFDSTSYTQAGILGATFFATALLAHTLAVRIRTTEELAAQRGLDLANLQQVNEYIIQNMEAGIIVVDEEHRVRLINESAWRLLGQPETHDQQLLSDLSASLYKQYRDWLKHADTEIRPFKCQADSAEIIAKYAPLGHDQQNGTLILLEDSAGVTQQLQQMKLASLGRLTASIAHEIRNPLGAISHAAQLLQESKKLEGPDYRLSEIIQNHSGRVNTIVENVLQLSRRERTNPRIINLKAWTESFIEEFCETEQLPVDSIDINIEPDNTMIQIDTSHLQQILWNLCQNAVKYGSIGDVPVHISLKGGFSNEFKGPYLDVIDKGNGIPEQFEDRIFEPFFTTSEDGTGLGLYITKELCECNKSRISYNKSSGGGSCFRLIFDDPRRIKT